MKTNDQPGKFNGPAEVRFVRVLPGPIERVWEYLTDPAKRARWLAGGTTAHRVGEKMRFDYRHKNLAPDETPPKEYTQHHEVGHSMESTILHCEPPRVLAFTFGSDAESVVTIELTPQGKEVQLVLTHRATAGDLPYMSEFGSGWHTHLGVLITELQGVPRAPFWPNFARHKAEYEKARLAATEAK